MNPETREFAIDLARQAGDLLLVTLARGLDARRTRAKAGHYDIVTEADEASERLLVAALRGRFPDHCIHAEESAGREIPACEWLWLIDPVDGTTNFAHGLPVFAVNLALARHGAPVLAVTHDPSAGRTYWAEQGGGAWVRAAGQDQRLHVSSVNDLASALLSTGFIANRVLGADRNRAEFSALDLKSQAVRRFGSAAVIMAWVAAGHLEAYWEAGLKPWDLAAGWLLITEAGGRVTDYDDGPMRLNSPHMIASNGQPGVHREIMATLAAIHQRQASGA